MSGPAWDIATAPQQSGSIITLTAAKPIQTIAECTLIDPTNPSAKKICPQPMTCYFGIASGQILGAGEQVIYTVSWGYGNFSFDELFQFNGGKITKIATWMRLSAQIFAAPGAGLGSTDNIRVRGMILPAAPALDREPSNFSTKKSTSGAIQFATRPTGVKRLWGWNYGATNDYLMLFDATSTPGAGTAPTYVVGYVQAQANFSLDLESTGLGFSNGVCLVASSTGDTLTADTSATINVSLESYPNPDF